MIMEGYVLAPIINSRVRGEILGELAATQVASTGFKIYVKQEDLF